MAGDPISLSAAVEWAFGEKKGKKKKWIVIGKVKDLAQEVGARAPKQLDDAAGLSVAGRRRRASTVSRRPPLCHGGGQASIFGE